MPGMLGLEKHRTATSGISSDPYGAFIRVWHEQAQQPMPLNGTQTFANYSVWTTTNNNATTCSSSYSANEQLAIPFTGALPPGKDVYLYFTVGGFASSGYVWDTAAASSFSFCVGSLADFSSPTSGALKETAISAGIYTEFGTAYSYGLVS